jgi:2-succinyl-6-hydroxy-2,4-cyclohexadiene-1-carboxylate synthase
VAAPRKPAQAAQAVRLNAAGVGLRVLRRGNPDAPPLIVLHGFTGSAETMAGVSEALAEDYCVHALDLVGHGESDAPESLEFYSMERCVGQLLAALDALGLERAHFLGYSMGGRVALSLALAAPGRVSSLVLIGVSPGPESVSARSERVEADDALAERILDHGIEAFVDAWMALPLFASQARLGAEALEIARKQRLACRPLGLANSLRGMGSGAMPPLSHRLAELELPVLLVAGSEDAKFGAIAREMLPRLLRAELLEIAEAGHAAHLEQPGVFASGCRRFLRSAQRAGPAPGPGSRGRKQQDETPTETRPEPGEKRLQ